MGYIFLKERRFEVYQTFLRLRQKMDIEKAARLVEEAKALLAKTEAEVTSPFVKEVLARSLNNLTETHSDLEYSLLPFKRETDFEKWLKSPDADKTIERLTAIGQARK